MNELFFHMDHQRRVQTLPKTNSMTSNGLIDLLLGHQNIHTHVTSPIRYGTQMVDKYPLK